MPPPIDQYERTLWANVPKIGRHGRRGDRASNAAARRRECRDQAKRIVNARGGATVLI